MAEHEDGWCPINEIYPSTETEPQDDHPRCPPDFVSDTPECALDVNADTNGRCPRYANLPAGFEIRCPRHAMLPPGDRGWAIDPEQTAFRADDPQQAPAMMSFDDGTALYAHPGGGHCVRATPEQWRRVREVFEWWLEESRRAKRKRRAEVAREVEQRRAARRAAAAAAAAAKAEAEAKERRFVLLPPKAEAAEAKPFPPLPAPAAPGGLHDHGYPAAEPDPEHHRRRHGPPPPPVLGAAYATCPAHAHLPPPVFVRCASHAHAAPPRGFARPDDDRLWDYRDERDGQAPRLTYADGSALYAHPAGTHYVRATAEEFARVEEEWARIVRRRGEAVRRELERAGACPAPARLARAPGFPLFPAFRELPSHLDVSEVTSRHRAGEARRRIGRGGSKVGSVAGRSKASDGCQKAHGEC
jgi:hypothetical protein